ncbi:MAG: LysR family transcriptional regulator [Clostridia bacterium]|jgi:DNA-binding transcriptional LysR family regulator|nr:LysR family transcriptional regulator [Clostridia bacterium]
MNINLDLYKVFYEVAKTGNITKASENLLISQPAVSKSIKNLESQLGGTLFIRTKKGVVLTDEGNTFYEYISKAMAYIDSAESNFKDMINLDSGKIKIGINSMLAETFLTKYLNIFHELYPKISIEIISGTKNESIQKLKEGLVNLVIGSSIKVNDSSLKSIKCSTLTPCLFVGPKYKELVNKPIEIEDLKEYPFVLLSKKSSARNFLEEKINFENYMELTTYSLVHNYTKIGFGIGHTHKEYIEAEVKNKELYILDLLPALPSKDISLIVSNRYKPNFSSKKLIEIIKRELI